MNAQQARPLDRLSWLWLATGAALLPFWMFQTVWPLAAWVSPVFLMRFSRTRRLRVGLPVIFLVLCGGFAIGWRDDFVPLPLDIPPLQSVLLRGGLIMLGLNCVRYFNGIPMRHFTLVLGVLALLVGIGGMTGVDLPFFPVLLIIIGADILFKSANRSQSMEPG